MRGGGYSMHFKNKSPMNMSNQFNMFLFSNKHCTARKNTLNYFDFLEDISPPLSYPKKIKLWVISRNYLWTVIICTYSYCITIK